MSTQYGYFSDFCYRTGDLRSTLPVCNFFSQSESRGGGGWGGPALNGINLSGDRHLANLGSILVAGLAILITAGLLWRSDKKKAAVGRREMQLFLIGFIIIEICEIFAIGWFPLSGLVRRVFAAIQVAAIIADTWLLLMNGAVGFQLLDDGTPLSLALIFGSAAALFVGTGYIALDTGFSWTGYFNDSLQLPNRSYPLYTLNFLAPLVFLVVFFILESVLILRVLGEVRPMISLIAAALLFAAGQIFQFVISIYICRGTNGAINGGFFESLFNLAAVVAVWTTWNSITEDTFDVGMGAGSTYT